MISSLRIMVLICTTAILSTLAAHAQLPGRLESNGTKLAYWRIEAREPSTGKPPLYFLHGGPGFDCKYLADSTGVMDLAQDHTLVLYDQRGVGESALLADGQSCTVDDQVEDLERLRLHLGDQRIDLAGHSWGGFLAMAYAQKYPDALAHLVLIDSMPMRYDDDFCIFADVFPAENAVMIEQQTIALFKDDQQAAAKSLAAYMSMLFTSPTVRDRFLQGSAGYTHNSRVNRKLNNDASGMDLTPVISGFPHPILIVHGEDDANISIASAEVIAQAAKGGQLARMASCGHLPFYEKPEEFVRVMRDFLDS